MDDYRLFRAAANELDELTREGAFGQSAKELLSERDSQDYVSYSYNCLMDMFADENIYGFEYLVGITFRFIKLYADSMAVSSQETVDVLAAFLMGTKEHPELECLSSYTTYLSAHTSFWNLTRSLNDKTNTTNYDRKQLAAALLTTYSKGVELVGKAFTQLIYF